MASATITALRTCGYSARIAIHKRTRTVAEIRLGQKPSATVPEGGLEPPLVSQREFESRASADSATPASGKASNSTRWLLASGAPALQALQHASLQARRCRQAPPE